jgi:hypothetical protein
MFLLQQNQRLENRCAIYQLQVQRLEAEMERLKKLELEVAELRERLGQNSQTHPNRPLLIRLQFHARTTDSRAVASGVVNLVIKDAPGKFYRRSKSIR